MARVSRDNAAPPLIAFMLIDVAIWVYTETAGARLNAGHDLTAQQIIWTALDALLVWRIWRGGRISWAILLVLSILPLAQMVVGAIGWTAYMSGLAAFLVAQILLLMAPAVRDHVSRSRQPAG